MTAKKKNQSDTGSQNKKTPTQAEIRKSRNWALFAFLAIFVVIFYTFGMLRIKTG